MFPAPLKEVGEKKQFNRKQTAENNLTKKYKKQKKQIQDQSAGGDATWKVEVEAVYNEPRNNEIVNIMKWFGFSVPDYTLLIEFGSTNHEVKRTSACEYCEENFHAVIAFQAKSV